MAAIIQSLRNAGDLKIGVSRDDLAVGDTITVNSQDTATTYAWNLVFTPEGSAAAFDGDVTQQSPGDFIADREGPYLVRLIVDLGLPTEDTQFVRLRYLTILGDLALVAAGESVTPTGNIPVDLTATGWANDQNRNLQTLLSLIQSVVSSGRLLYVDANATGGTGIVDPNSGLVEGYGNFDKVQDAITEAVTQGAGITTPWLVVVRPGLYTENITFEPHVHVMGWPGNPQGDTRTTTLRTDAGLHSVDLSSVTDLCIISGLTLENIVANTDPVFRKGGNGHLLAHRVKFTQQGLSGTQGAAAQVVGGTAEFDHCTLVFSPSTSPGLVAFSQTRVLVTSSTTFRSCTLTGPSGMHLDPAFVGGVVTNLIDTDVTSTVIGGAAINTAAQDLTIQYSRVRAPLGTPLAVNPTAVPLGSLFGVTARWSFFDGDLVVDVGGGGGALNLGSVEYGAVTFPSGTGGLTFAATTKAKSLYYDNVASGLTAETVQDAIDEVTALAVLITTLDDAYDGGIPGSGSGNRIVADVDPVEIVDAASPSDPIPANIQDGKLRVVGGVEVGALTKPEIDLTPNPYGNGPQVLMGWTTWANGSIFGTSATIMARALPTPLFRNYNLRLQSQSAKTGGDIGRVILRGGDALSNGGITPDAASLYLQAGSGLDALAGAAGDIFLVPGDSQAGPSGSIILARPQSATPAFVTAAAPWVGGVTGDINIATDMGAITVSVDAADGFAAVLAKFTATGHVVATDSGGGVIRLTSVTTGPTAEVYFLSADVGVDASLGTFNGQIPVAGTWPDTIAVRVSAANEVSFGLGGATGPMIYNSDTGKLTVPGVIDPTALIFEFAAAPTVAANHAGLFVSDGSGGLNAGDLYYSDTGGASILNLSAAAAGVVEIRDEGTPLGTFSIIDFIGADVQAFGLGSVARVYIPPPTFNSHWNTSDGDNGNQSVTESISRTSARIATPFGGEGSPFKTNGWANTNQDATTTSGVILTTPGTTTGFGGDSTMLVVVFDADGVTPLDTYLTPAITGNVVLVSGSGRITVTITSYGPDAFRNKANASVAVDAAGIFADNALSGGRYHVAVRHTPDSFTDGSGPYNYVQSDVFLDTNPTTPSISGLVTLGETGGSLVTKHLSGIEYYTTGSQFTVDVADIDQLNRNTARTSQNLRLIGTEPGLPTLNHSPFGTGSANFTGWTSDNNVDGVDYQKTDWAINASNYRYIGPSANVSSYPRDTWADGGTINSSDAAIMVDTYGTTSTDLVENFDDENRRQGSGYNGGTSPGNWPSTVTLGAGHALVFGGQMMVPNQSTFIRSDGPNTPNANWTTYKPDLGGANPDYSVLGAPVSHYRTIVDTSGLNRASFQMVFTGTFVANATTDLANGDIEIYIRRRASAGGGDTGPGANPLRLDGPLYNFATFDDGVTDGQIREASSSGNTVNGTFGGFSCETGFFIEVKIITATVKIDSYSVTFF